MREARERALHLSRRRVNRLDVESKLAVFRAVADSLARLARRLFERALPGSYQLVKRTFICVIIQHHIIQTPIPIIEFKGGGDVTARIEIRGSGVAGNRHGAGLAIIAKLHFANRKLTVLVQLLNLVPVIRMRYDSVSLPLDNLLVGTLLCRILRIARARRERLPRIALLDIGN